MKAISTVLSFVIIAGVASADAAVLCARRRSDGTFNGNVAIREVCRESETRLDPVSLGLQEPSGPQGPASLDGIACDTGSLDAPGGQTVSSVDAATGLMTLHCVSASTNPVLAVGLLAGPRVCNSFGFCFVTRLAVREVDASGALVINGFSCDPGAPNLSVFPIGCETQRFPTGATVRLRAIGGSGSAPIWTGCDTVSGDTCTMTLTGDRAVAVQPN
jgi:hypothetical protein